MLRVHKSRNVLSWISEYKNKVVFTSICNTVYTLPKLKIEKKSFKRPNFGLCETFIKNEIPVNLVLENFQKKLRPGDVLVEVFPGKGVLTKKILSTFDNKFLLCKPHKFLVKDIKALFPHRFSQISISDIEVQKFFKYFYQSVYHNFPDHHKKFVNFLKSHSPPDKLSKLIIVGTITNDSFFYSLIYDYVYRASFFHENLNPTFYTFVPNSIYKHLLKLNGNMKIPLPTSFNIYFDIEVLGSAPISSFHVSSFKRKHYGKMNDCTDFFLLKITPKDYNDIIEKTGKNVAEFNRFLQYTIRLNAPSFLFAVESYVYNFGEELIQNGFQTFAKISDISKDQWFKCFELIKLHRHYNPSLFESFSVFSKELGELKTEYHEEDEAFSFDLHEEESDEHHDEVDKMEALDLID
ncbi:UNVERIFIED_CONTAM: hypothetical protein RMT77_007056 [Armadillidium vulgare]